MEKVQITRHKQHTSIRQPDVYTEKIKSIENLIKQLQNKLNVGPKKYDEARQLYANIGKELNELGYCMPYVSNLTNFQEINLSTENAMDIQYYDESRRVVVFKMDSLPPHRTTIDVSTGKQRYTYNRSKAATSYRNSLNLFLQSNTILPRSNIFVWFRCLIPENSGIVFDADNMDVKVFIDTCISKVFVYDDNILNIGYMITGEITSENNMQTIIYVGDKKDVFAIDRG